MRISYRKLPCLAAELEAARAACSWSRVPDEAALACCIGPCAWCRDGMPAAPQAGGLRSCRATGPKNLRVIFFVNFFSKIPLPPCCRAARSRPSGSGAAGIYLCKFKNQKYIFVKTKIKNIKIKKTAQRNCDKIKRGPFDRNEI